MNRLALVVTSAAVVLGAVAAACVAWLPAWIVGDAVLPAMDRLRAENDVRATLLQSLAGLLALADIALGASVTLRQVRVNREGQFIDLFTRAVEQLASAEGRRAMVLPGTGVDLERAHGVPGAAVRS